MYKLIFRKNICFMLKPKSTLIWAKMAKIIKNKNIKNKCTLKTLNYLLNLQQSNPSKPSKPSKPFKNTLMWSRWFGVSLFFTIAGKELTATILRIKNLNQSHIQRKRSSTPYHSNPKKPLKI